MEIKFFTEEKILDLSGQKITVQDSNSRMSDKMFSKYFFPFEIYMNEEFVNTFGDYESDDAADLQSTFKGTLLFENKIHEAKLVLSNTEGKMITGQIDFGFEDLPNFDKKLSELPLHKFSVGDIHTFAKDICAKNYPETDFNFPRMYTKKYSPDDELWDAFNGYYNDLKTDGSEMNRNSIDGEGNIFNANIIHPTPHLLYVLKTLFADANLILAGEILTDPIFSQRWIFSGTEYFSRLTQRRRGIQISLQDYIERIKIPWSTYPFGIYDSETTISKPGKYRVVAKIKLNTYKSGLSDAVIKIYLNGNLIHARSTGGELNYTLETEITTTSENEVFRITAIRQFADGDGDKFVICDIFSKDTFEDETLEGEDNGVITNLNEIDLSKAVPNMMCKDLINIMRNRFNYGLEINGNIAIMDKIGKDPVEIKDFTTFEVAPANRTKTLLQNRSFLLSSTELDDGPQTSMFFDSEGAVPNKAAKDDTIIIDSNVIIIQVGVALPQGQNTAIIKKDTDDALQLVYYDGLTGVQNNAKNPPGAEYPELFFTHWEKWLRQRIRGYEFKWKFQIPAEEFDYKITDHIYCYKNVHNIKTWTKDLVENIYEVDIVTESI